MKPFMLELGSIRDYGSVDLCEGETWDGMLQSKFDEAEFQQPDYLDWLRTNKWAEPVLVDADEDTIIDGHHRIAVAISMGYTHVPAIRVDIAHMGESYKFAGDYEGVRA